jgi:hypothetical protein
MGEFTGLRVQLVTYRHTHQLILEQHISRRVNIAPEEADLHPSSTQTATDARSGRATAGPQRLPGRPTEQPGRHPRASRQDRQARAVASTIGKPAPSLVPRQITLAPLPAALRRQNTPNLT